MRAAPGDFLPTLRREITREGIAAYAEASGDHNPIHLDEAFARSVGLPGVIAHGMLQMGVLATMVAAWAGDPRRVRKVGCRFAGMVRPGDTLVCGGRVAEVEAGVAGLELWAENQEGVRVVSRAFAEVALEGPGPESPS